MGEEQKELVRLESFWIDTWLRQNYEGIEIPLHRARCVGQGSGQAHLLSSPRRRRHEDQQRLPLRQVTAGCALFAEEWNIYLFHFSDGDNSSEADSRDCVKLLKEQLLPICNMFGYCQVASAYGSGNFINVLHEHLRNHEKVLTSRVNSKDDIYDSIKTFFGKGH